MRRESKSIFKFARDPIFDEVRKPTKRMIKRAVFWKEWKERRAKKGEENGSKVQSSADQTTA